MKRAKVWKDKGGKGGKLEKKQKHSKVNEEKGYEDEEVCEANLMNMKRCLAQYVEDSLLETQVFESLRQEHQPKKQDTTRE